MIARQHQDCNLQVAYPSTPANYFHLLRRQVHRDFRKPLVLFFSKNLLRHPNARSTLEEMVGETRFERFIPETSTEVVADDQVKRVILCSGSSRCFPFPTVPRLQLTLSLLALTGQVYQTLLKEREDRKINDVILCRVEQISPFPYDMVTPYIDQFPNADIVWCQEEPLNAGAWSYIQPRLYTVFKQTENHKQRTPIYAGRNPSSSPATGKKAIHLAEIKQFLDQAFDLSHSA